MLTTIDYSAFSFHDQELDAMLPDTLKLLEIEKPLFDMGSGHSSITNSLNEDELRTATKFRLFAEMNGYTFFGNLAAHFPDPSSVFAHAKLLSAFRSITHGVILPFEGGWLEVGQLRIIAGKHDSSAIYHRYVKIVSAISLPNACIDSVGSALNPHIINPTYQKQQTESSEFNSLFDLYAPREQMVEVLSILTPDVMEKLMLHFNDFDIEFRDGHLFFIDPYSKLIGEDDIKTLLTTTLELSELLAPKVKRKSMVHPPETINKYLKMFNYLLVSIDERKRIAHKEAMISVLVAVCSVGIPLLICLYWISFNP